MSERAPYSRVYWSVIDDEKFREVYDDDRALACWLRLLIAADAIWPAPASIPATARKAPVAVLVRVGLVDLQPGGRYRIHGLDSERGVRRLAATRLRLGQDPTGPQLVPNRDPVAFEVPGRSLAEPSLAETSRAEGASDLGGAGIYYEVTLSYPNKASLKDWTNQLAQDFGEDAFRTALATEFATSRDKSTILSRTQAKLAMDADRAASARKSARAARQVAAKPNPEETPEQREIREAKWADVQKQIAQIGLRPKKETE